MLHLLLASLFPFVLSFTPDIVYPHIQSKDFDNGHFGPYPNRSYFTEPKLTSPRLNVQQSDSRCHDGLYIMTNIRGNEVDIKGKSPMIHDANGSLVWMNASYGETFGHGVQRYKGQDYLTFWKGDDDVHGHGEGMYFMLDSNYREAYKFSAGNGRLGDLHEFRITAAGTVLITQYRYERGTWGDEIRKPLGYIWDSVFQEIDIETNAVLFEWHAYDHVDINTSDFPPGSKGRTQASGYDFFHINSVEKDSLGNYLISSMHYQAVMYIDGKTHETLWQLGGKQNSFTDLSDGQATKFGYQHDARWDEDHGGITLFDNGARYDIEPDVDASRGVHIELDFKSMTAKIKQSYINPRKIISGSQGSMQTLPSGNVLLGYGFNAAWTEFSAEGEVLCDVHIGSQHSFDTGAVQTYKVLKHAWVGLPLTKPEATFIDGWVHMSWNGATEVQTWVIQGGNSTHMDSNWVLGELSFDKTGFETSVRIECSTWRFIRVRGVDTDGQVLGESKPVPVDCDYLHPGVPKFTYVLEHTSLSSSWAGSLLKMSLVGLCGGAVYSLWQWRLRQDTKAAFQELREWA